MDWNQQYVDEDIPWDKGGPAPALQSILNENSLRLPEGAVVMVPGCGRGHDAYLLACHGYSTIGMDLSEAAIQQAKSIYTHVHLSWRVGDLFSDLPEQEVDCVWEHTCYCAIPPEKREAYIEAMHRSLRPDGLLLGVFLVGSSSPSDDGPPFPSTVQDLKTQFQTVFDLEWELPPSVSFLSREYQDKVMCWRKRSA